MAEIEEVSKEVKERMSVIESRRKYADELLNKETTADTARVASDLHQRAAEILKFGEMQQTVQNFGVVEVSVSPKGIATEYCWQHFCKKQYKGAVTVRLPAMCS